MLDKEIIAEAKKALIQYENTLNEPYKGIATSTVLLDVLVNLMKLSRGDK